MSPRTDPAAQRRRPALAANLLLLTIVAFCLSMIAWAGLAELDEVTRGQGRVIPSRQMQIVQNLEGGIIEEIAVSQGDLVEPGDVIVRLDATQFGADYQQRRQEFLALKARLQRLAAEAQIEAPLFDEELRTGVPDVVAAEENLFAARFNELESTRQIFDAQRRQRQHALKQAEVNVASARRLLGLAQSQRDLLAPLVRKGVAPQLDLIGVEQRLAEAEGNIDSGELAISQAEAALEEVERQVETSEKRFRSRAVEELLERKKEHDGMVEELPALVDKVRRTEVRSPVRGVVNRVLVTTVGGVASPGMALAEVVPLEDTLLVEAEVSPKDIAFLHPEQEARVKITAYDYSVYGTLRGRLETISADAVRKDDGSSSYQVRIRTENLEHAEGAPPMQIIPGMIAEVDILTGKRSVLDYLLKPVVKLQQTAMRER